MLPRQKTIDVPPSSGAACVTLEVPPPAPGMVRRRSASGSIYDQDERTGRVVTPVPVRVTSSNRPPPLGQHSRQSTVDQLGVPAAAMAAQRRRSHSGSPCREDEAAALAALRQRHEEGYYDGGGGGAPSMLSVPASHRASVRRKSYSGSIYGDGQ